MKFGSLLFESLPPLISRKPWKMTPHFDAHVDHTLLQPFLFFLVSSIHHHGFDWNICFSAICRIIKTSERCICSIKVSSLLLRSSRRKICIFWNCTQTTLLCNLYRLPRVCLLAWMAVNVLEFKNFNAKKGNKRESGDENFQKVEDAIQCKKNLLKKALPEV